MSRTTTHSSSRRLPNTVRGAAGFAVLGGAALLHIGRQRGVPPWDSLWAEDGSVFLTDALRDFPGTVFDLNAGYLHVVPRMIAGVAALFSLDAGALVMAAGAALVVALVAGFVYAASAAVLRSRAARLGLAATALLIPVPGSELIANATNLHFYLVFACFWALFWQSETVGALAGRSTAVLAGALSDPLSALFLPLAAVAPVARRSPRALVVSSFFVAGLAVQLLFVRGGEGLQRNWGFNLGDLPDIFSLRVTGGMLVGDRFLDDLWLAYGRAFSYGALLLAALVVGFLVARSDRATSAFALVCLAYAGLFFCVQLVGRGTGGTDPDVGAFHLNGARYILLPFLFTVAAVLALVDRGAEARRSSEWSVWARRIALVWLAVLLATNYSVVTDRSRGPRWHEEITKARRSCAGNDMRTARILVAPAPPPVWFVRASCERLRPG